MGTGKVRVFTAAAKELDKSWGREVTIARRSKGNFG